MENEAQENNVIDINKTKELDTDENRQRIRGLMEKVKSLRADQKGINDEIKQQFEKLESIGINRQAAKEALKRLDMAQDQRMKRDESYHICLKALDIWYQDDLLDAINDDKR